MDPSILKNALALYVYLLGLKLTGLIVIHKAFCLVFIWNNSLRKCF